MSDDVVLVDIDETVEDVTVVVVDTTGFWTPYLVTEWTEQDQEISYATVTHTSGARFVPHQIMRTDNGEKIAPRSLCTAINTIIIEMPTGYTLDLTVLVGP